MSGDDSMIANKIVLIKSLCNKSKYNWVGNMQNNTILLIQVNISG